MDVEHIFEYWKLRLCKKRAKLDAKRRRLIEARLKDGYKVSDLLAAIDGCAASAFHNGENPQRIAYNDISLICRDAEHVDRFAEINETRQKKLQAQAAYQARLNH